MTTPKRSVSTHTRADGQRQSVNRLGGKFDDKTGAGAASAADPFDEVKLASVSQQHRQSLAVRHRRLERQIAELEETKRRSYISFVAVELHNVHPEVVEWHSERWGDGSDFLAAVVDTDGSTSEPTAAQRQTWNAVRDTMDLPTYRTNELHIFDDGFRVGLKNEEMDESWPMANPANVDDGSTMTARELGEVFDGAVVERDRAVERAMRFEMSGRLAYLRDQNPAATKFQVTRYRRGDIELVGVAVGDGPLQSSYEVNDDDERADLLREVEEEWRDQGGFDSFLFKEHDTESLVIGITDGKVIVEDAATSRELDSWPVENPDREPYSGWSTF